MRDQLGVGVVGVGAIGRRHAENLARRIPRARLVAVADVNPEAARSVAADLGAARWFTTADELAVDPDVEAVVVASSHHGHLEGIRAAASQRKDVFCEKPIAPTLADADAAIAAVAEAGVRLQIGFMRRYDRAYREAKRRIDAGEIGDPVLIKATHRNATLAPSLRPGDAASVAAGPVGAFIDSAIHDYDNARWLLGDEVVEVQAYMPASSSRRGQTIWRFRRSASPAAGWATSRFIRPAATATTCEPRSREPPARSSSAACATPIAP
jgi:predicted dehydrogenase